MLAVSSPALCLACRFLASAAAQIRPAGFTILRVYLYFIYISISSLRRRPKLPGRIYDSEGAGVWLDGCEGWVEGCQIWGHVKASVCVQGSGSQAVVKGCECATPGLLHDPPCFFLGPTFT